MTARGPDLPIDELLRPMPRPLMLHEWQRLRSALQDARALLDRVRRQGLDTDTILDNASDADAMLGIWGGEP